MGAEAPHLLLEDAPARLCGERGWGHRGWGAGLNPRP